jgi:hypothetical protein
LTQRQNGVSRSSFGAERAQLVRDSKLQIYKGRVILPPGCAIGVVVNYIAFAEVEDILEKQVVQSGAFGQKQNGAQMFFLEFRNQ